MDVFVVVVVVVVIDLGGWKVGGDVWLFGLVVVVVGILALIVLECICLAALISMVLMP